MSDADRWPQIEVHLRRLMALMLPDSAGCADLEAFLQAREYGVALFELAHLVDESVVAGAKS